MSKSDFFVPALVWGVTVLLWVEYLGVPVPMELLGVVGMTVFAVLVTAGAVVGGDGE